MGGIFRGPWSRGSPQEIELLRQTVFSLAQFGRCQTGQGVIRTWRYELANPFHGDGYSALFCYLRYSVDYSALFCYLRFLRYLRYSALFCVILRVCKLGTASSFYVHTIVTADLLLFLSLQTKPISW